MRPFFKNQQGATAIEYAVIIAVVVLALITGLTMLKTGTGGIFGNVAAAAQSHM